MWKLKGRKRNSERGHTASKTRINAVLLLLAAILSYSLPAYYVPNVPANYIFLIVSGSFLLLNVSDINISPFTAILICVVQSSAIVSALHWTSGELARVPMYVLLSLLMLSCANSDSIEKFVEAASVLVLIALAGAVVGFFYALFGGAPLMAYKNPDGIDAYMYLGSISNSVQGNYIRPSGFFDEPGTLSFVTCFVVAMRHYLGKSRRLSWVMLISGLITLSLAHVAFVVVFLLSTRNIRTVWLVLASIAALLLMMRVSPELANALSDRFFSRFEVVDGALAGDSRSELLSNAWSYLDHRVFLWGLDPVAFVARSGFEGTYLMIGQNPLTNVVIYGLFLSLPYYLSLVVLAIRAFLHNGGVAAGLFLLLLQRPYSMAFGYALFILIAIDLSFRSPGIFRHGEPQRGLRSTSCMSLQVRRSLHCSTSNDCPRV
jgi:hypothetical protein